MGGDGVVRLVDADGPAGALLLERLDADRDLRSTPVENALDVAADLLRRLHVPDEPGYGLPAFTLELDDAIAEISRGLADTSLGATPVPHSERALEWARAVRNRSWARVVNTDLHYENVLAGTREPWLVVDPKVAVGPIGYGLAPLLWNRTTEIIRGPGLNRAFERLVDRAGADIVVAREATLLRCVAYLWWTRRAGASRSPSLVEGILTALA